MFTSFVSDSGLRFDAYFYDAKTDRLEAREVTGWVTGDDGLSQATVLVYETGTQARVGLFGNFLGVLPKGQLEQHQAFLDAKIEALKKQASANAVAEAPTPVAEA